MFEIVGGILVLLLTVLFSGIKAVKDSSALVIYRCGKISRCVGPGLQFVFPLIEKSESFDTRIVTLPIEHLSEITMDNYPVNMSAVCFYQISDPKRCAAKIQDVAAAVQQACEISMRTMVGQHDVRHLLSDKMRINFTLKTILERRLREFGVRVVSIEVKEVQLTTEGWKAIAADPKGQNGNGMKLAQAAEESLLRMDPLRDD